MNRTQLFISKNTFEIVYDKYCSLLMHIALELSSTKEEAEEILFITFSKAAHLKIDQQRNDSICSSLIKLLIQTAQHHLPTNTPISNLKLKFLENTPILHKILCNQLKLEIHCDEYNITRSQIAKVIREEFDLLHTTKK